MLLQPQCCLGATGLFEISDSFGPDDHVLLKSPHDVCYPQASFFCMKKSVLGLAGSHLPSDFLGCRFTKLMHTLTHTHQGADKEGFRRAVNPVLMFLSLVLSLNERYWNWLKMLTLERSLMTLTWVLKDVTN